jgi:hypothetical protein
MAASKRRKTAQSHGVSPWADAKSRCRLNAEDVRMAKALGLDPRDLISNVPSPAQTWKQPVKAWIRELFRNHEEKAATRQGRQTGPVAAAAMPATEADGARAPEVELESIDDPMESILTAGESESGEDRDCAQTVSEGDLLPVQRLEDDAVRRQGSDGQISYDRVLGELNKASTFDLYRLQAAIGKLLSDPQRLQAIKRRLSAGMQISYFDERRNCLVPARVLEVRKSRALLAELEGGEHWTVPLYMLNLEGTDTSISPPRGQLDRLSSKVGDRVGFENRDGQSIFGTISKLNPKRAKVQTTTGVWNVPYSMLFPIIEGEQGGESLVQTGP